jgi:glycosyltransferase involved in cell wall biosynthesis
MGRIPGFVSVVIPSLDAGPQLLEQVNALDGQDYSGPVEVIVADNGSRDGSIEAVTAWSRGRPSVRIVDARHRRGPGAARNAGVRVALGDFLAFCDADDVVSESWLRLLLQTAADADVVGGRLESARLNDEAARRCYGLTDPSRPHLGFLPTAAGSNLGVWADVFARIGGFDERARTCEDVDFVWRAQLLGLTYRPSEALVHKRFPTGPLDAARRFFGYGKGSAWLYRRFASAGMPRRTPQETLDLWKHLARGFPGNPAPQRRMRWTMMMAMSCGRLAGSLRYRTLFT